MPATNPPKGIMTYSQNAWAISVSLANDLAKMRLDIDQLVSLIALVVLKSTRADFQKGIIVHPELILKCRPSDDVSQLHESQTRTQIEMT